MIKSLKIEGFKKFASHLFEMAPLTVLAGMNGAGKTSFVHALLLAREASGASNVVQLNGPWGLELGTFEDIQNFDAPDAVRFELTDNTQKIYSWTLVGKPLALYAEVGIRPETFPQAFGKEGRWFQYLSAERFGPRSVLSSAALPPGALEVGVKGEFCAQVLYTLSSEGVPKGRRCDDEPSEEVSLLKAEAELWLSRIARPVQIDTEVLPGTSVTALKFRYGDDWVRPPNMGFGVTYSLPVILAALTAPAGGLLLVENPEAHLHPAGQSQMGQFLAKVAASGVQVVLETHSDHVLNGIRRAIGEARSLPATDAIVHYFNLTAPQPQALLFSDSGGIDNWPAGFFDQYQLDISALTRVRRPKK